MQIKFLEQYENTSNIVLARVIKEDNKKVFHYKVNDEIVFLYVEFNSEGNVIDTKEKRTKDVGVNPLNNRTQIDGPSTPNLSYDKENTRNLIKEFIDNILIPGGGKTINKISEYISNEKYYQHNVDNGIGDGLDELLRSIKEMNAYGSDLQYDETIIQVVEGDFSFTISNQNWLNPETKETEVWQYFDLFRVEDNKIVEHWDILGRVK